MLTVGALLLLVADVLLPRGSKPALTWVAVAVLVATRLSLVPFANVHVEISNGLIAVDSSRSSSRSSSSSRRFSRC